MPKIKVEIEVPDAEDCDDVDDAYCPMCKRNIWGEYHCFLFGDELETDKENDYSCKRCDKCKQAEVKDEHSSN